MAAATKHSMTNNRLPATAQGGLSAALALDGAGSNDRGIYVSLVALTEGLSRYDDEEDRPEKSYERSSSHRQGVRTGDSGRLRWRASPPPA
jgi:hypothetical protein